MVPRRDTCPPHKMSWWQGCWQVPTGAGIPRRFLTTPPPTSSPCTFLISGTAKDLDTGVIGTMVPKSALCSLYRLLPGWGCLAKDRELKIPILGCRSLSRPVRLFIKFTKVSLPRKKINIFSLSLVFAKRKTWCLQRNSSLILIVFISVC